LQSIEEKGVLKAKVEDLNTLIASREKQFNQITTASSYQIQEQYMFEENGFEFLQIFVHDGKQYYLGTDRIVGPHIYGSSPESHFFPDGSQAMFGDIDDE